MPKPDAKTDAAADDKEAARLKYIKADVTAADFNSTTHILVTGFSNGVFFIHEMPEAQLIHSLSISDQSILSVALNPSGDWIAFGCENLGQVTFTLTFYPSSPVKAVGSKHFLRALLMVEINKPLSCNHNMPSSIK